METLPKEESEISSTSQVKLEETEENVEEEKNVVVKEEKKVEVKYFQCENCDLRERYDYFGNDPHFVKRYKLLENAYVIEDPFVPPKQGEFIVLGTHCIKCNKSVCKDSGCSFYFEGTYCISCAKDCKGSFPPNVQEKLNKIVVS